jgi:SPP1 family phage portal protein
MKLQFLSDPTVELTTDYIGRAIQQFISKEQPRLNKQWNYYKGKQKITKKRATDVGKPCNIIVSNYCKGIVDKYLGYLTGIPVTYTNEDFQGVINVLNYNDVAQEDGEYLRQALIFGRAFEVNYIDEEGKQRFRLFDPRQCLPIYSNSLNNELLYVVRFYQENTNLALIDDYYVEVYGPHSVTKYKSDIGFTSFTLVDQYEHYYDQCPVTVFSLNEDEDCIFESIITLQDAYNTLLSAGVDDLEAFADAYLVLKGVVADDEDLKAMKMQRVLMIDSDADASYLTKETRNDAFEFLLDTIHKQIHRISLTPDYTDKDFMAQSGEAIKYKLTGFETAASNIQNHMLKALQRRIELICSIFNLYGEEQWRDVEIHFTRNLPNSLTPMTVNELTAYKSLVSDETLLGLVPFVSDVDNEMEKMDKQTQKELNEEWSIGERDNFRS